VPERTSSAVIIAVDIARIPMPDSGAEIEVSPEQVVVRRFL
jgi:hypothetical protein